MCRTGLWLAVGVLFFGLPVSAQDKSVKPGINKTFENPDVAQFVERFEKEGREIYDRRDKIVAACGLRSGENVADIGAGTGLFTRLFAARVGPQGRVYAVDIAPKFIEHIRQTCQEQKIENVVGVVCQADSCDLAPESVDAAFICDTYHHFEFPQKTMHTVHQALRPGGRLYVVDFQRVEGVSSEWVLNHVRAGKDVVRKEIEAAGFEFVEEKPVLKDNYFMCFRKKG